jgi:hypothetical protein
MRFPKSIAPAVANITVFNPDDNWDKADMTPPPDEPK